MPAFGTDPNKKRGQFDPNAALAGLQDAGAVISGPTQPGMQQNSTEDSLNMLRNMQSPSNVALSHQPPPAFKPIQDTRAGIDPSILAGQDRITMALDGRPQLRGVAEARRQVLQGPEWAKAGWQQQIDDYGKNQNLMREFSDTRMRQDFARQHTRPFEQEGFEIGEQRAGSTAARALREQVASKRDLNEVELEPAMKAAYENAARRSPAALSGEATIRATEIAGDRAQIMADADRDAANSRQFGAVAGPAVRAYLENLSPYNNEGEEEYAARKAAMDAALAAALRGDPSGYGDLGLDPSLAGLVTQDIGIDDAGLAEGDPLTEGAPMTQTPQPSSRQSIMQPAPGGGVMTRDVWGNPTRVLRGRDFMPGTR